MHKPIESHFQAAYKILKYLKSIIEEGSSTKNMMHYKLKVKTSSRYYTFIGSNLTIWRSIKKLNIRFKSSETVQDGILWIYLLSALLIIQYNMILSSLRRWIDIS